MDIPSLKRETRYGAPAADQILYNRNYALGYSYYFRQAKWALEIVNPNKAGLARSNNFRPDYRIPDIFRADLVDFVDSGYDRGHLVASEDQIETQIQNSETFLLSNMTPQAPQFNQGIWKKLETEIRRLAAKPKIYETYVICGPLFYFDQPVKSIGAGDDNEVTIPIPNAYFKSILTENNRGTLNMWSFVLPNEPTTKELETFRTATKHVEKLAGIKLWERLEGSKVSREKSRVRKMW